MISRDAQRYRDEEIVDAIVIGTGPGGAPILTRLAQAGLKVVALEAGRHWASNDHAADEIEAGEIYWREERLSGGNMPLAFGANNSGLGVGGSTLHWGAFCPRPDPRDLRLKTLTGLGRDWPIEFAELAASLTKVERFIGVSGPTPYPWDSERSYLLPPVARNAPADAMAKGCTELGITSADAPAALVSSDWRQPDGSIRKACVNCGACHQGCRNGAKASMDVTYLPVALAAGAEIRSECRVTGIECDIEGRVSGVVYRHGEKERRQRCAALFLCAGGVETPRLLLHCGLANSSGQVGRNFTAHVATQVWGTFDAEMRCNRGYPSSLISEDMLRPKDADFAGGYIIQSLGVLPVTLATSFARGGKLWGRALVELLDGYLHLAGIGINGECLTSDNNRLTLSDETDAYGVPKAHVTFGYGPNEIKLDDHARTVMTRIWEAAGADNIVAIPRAAHTIGTCRMGQERGDAVVASSGRSFDIDNLWICDNSIFPSSLAANPALTIMALSERTADCFLAARY